MNISDELLAAYLDGELQGAERARIEQAILNDSRLAQRVAQYRKGKGRTRLRLQASLREPMPQRLFQSARATARPATAQVIDLARVRAERKRRTERHRFLQSHRLVIAASVLGGLLLGVLADRLVTGSALTAYQGGTLTAAGALSAALDQQLGNAAANGSRVRVGMTFRSRNGNYCRTFSVDEPALSGLACHEQSHWHILTLVDTPAMSAPLERTVALSTPPTLSPLVLQTVRSRISGAPLDAQDLLRARNANWH